MESNVILLRRFVEESGGQSRPMGDFRCSACSAIFTTRADRLHVMTGLCKTCANKQAGRKRATHGFNNKNSRLHVTWANMKRRCLSQRGSEVQKYSDITLCHEWMCFQPFMEWSLANGYSDSMTIDRIDTLKGYFPENCRYVDHSVQAANRRITAKNKSGHVGVSFDRGKWVSKVQWRRKQIHLGRFDKIEDAISARNVYIDQHDLPHLRA